MKLQLIGSSGLISALLLGALIAQPCATRAAPPARVSLFDGKTLTGWTLVTCDAVVQDGAIFLRGGNGLVQSEKKYRDYVFECEWRPLKAEKWDSGIYFRYLTIPSTRAWPQRYQVNLRQGEEGNLVGVSAAQSKGLFRDHEWNQLKLTVRGTHVALEVNGKLAWSTDPLASADAGYIALQSEVPGGGQHLFRNIFITELAPPELAAVAAPR